MTANPLKVFFLTYYPPVPTMGGAMAFHRHFVEHNDFELFVATTDRRVVEHNPPYPVLLFREPAWLERLSRTRLSRWVHSYRHLMAGNFIPGSVWQAAQQFRPDFIFTIAGPWDWTTLMSQRLAHKLRVPLVGSFNDWFDFSAILHPWARPLLEQKFRSFYQACDLAWCTCEGMRAELGPHPNAQILYPVGALLQLANGSTSRPVSGKTKFVVAFAGNLGNWYGKMLEQLIMQALAHDLPIEFRIFGGNPSWGADFDQRARSRGIFRGHLPFPQLREEMNEVDGLLLLMGFEADCALTERTSFKTKFLDYLAFQKPILVWGPEYCSAVQYAREFDSAEACTSPDPAAFLQKIAAVSHSAERRMTLIANARRMYEDRFHPDKIHAKFVQMTRQMVEAFHSRAGK